MSTYNSIPEMLLTVTLINLENNPELLNILKCYFEGISDISEITTVEAYPYPNITAKYVVIYNKPLAHVLYKFHDNFDYVKVFSVFFTLVARSDKYYIFNSFFNSIKILINKKDLEQYYSKIGY